MTKLKRLLAIVMILALSVSFVLPAFAKTIDDFADADKANGALEGKGKLEDTYADAVQLMIDLQVMVGNADGSLNLGGTLTRAEFTVMLYKVLNGGSAIEVSGQNFALMPAHFTDITGEWYFAYANWVGVTGISAGVGDGKFEGWREINYDEALTLCMKSIGLDTTVGGKETGWKYESAVVQSFAWQLGMLGDLYPMANGIHIDRAAACLLFEYTVKAPWIGYSPVTGVRYRRNGDADQSAGLAQIDDYNLLEKKFGYSKIKARIIADGNWLALNGYSANAGDGRARLQPLDWKSDNVGSPFRITKDLTKSLGITWEHVGHTIELIYQKDSTDRYGDHNTILRSELKVLTNEVYYAKMTDDGFMDDVNGLVGMTLDNDQAKTYVDYVYNAGLSGANLDDIDDGDFEEGIGFRVIYDGDASAWGHRGIQFVFIEKYNVVVFDEVQSYDPYNWALASTNGGTWVGNADSKKNANVYTAGSVAKGDVLLQYGLGVGKSAVKKISDTIVGELTEKRNDDTRSVVGGKTYIISNIGAEVGTKPLANFSSLALGSEVTYWMWQDKVVHAVGKDTTVKRPDDFCLVMDTRMVMNPGSYGGLAGSTYTYYVYVLFPDNSKKTYELNTIFKTNTSNEVNGTYKLEEGSSYSTFRLHSSETYAGDRDIIDKIWSWEILDNDKIDLYQINRLGAGKSAIGDITNSSSAPMPAGFFANSNPRYTTANGVFFVKTNPGTYNAYNAARLPKGTGGTASWLNMTLMLDSALNGTEAAVGSGNTVKTALFTVSNTNHYMAAPMHDGTRYAYLLGRPWEVLIGGDRYGRVYAMLDDGTKVELETVVNEFANIKNAKAMDVIRYDEVNGRAQNAKVINFGITGNTGKGLVGGFYGSPNVLEVWGGSGWLGRSYDNDNLKSFFVGGDRYWNDTNNFGSNSKKLTVAETVDMIGTSKDKEDWSSSTHFARWIEDGTGKIIYLWVGNYTGAAVPLKEQGTMPAENTSDINVAGVNVAAGTTYIVFEVDDGVVLDMVDVNNPGSNTYAIELVDSDYIVVSVNGGAGTASAETVTFTFTAEGLFSVTSISVNFQTDGTLYAETPEWAGAPSAYGLFITVTLVGDEFDSTIQATNPEDTFMDTDNIVLRGLDGVNLLAWFNGGQSVWDDDVVHLKTDWGIREEIYFLEFDADAIELFADTPANVTDVTVSVSYRGG